MATKKSEAKKLTLERKNAWNSLTAKESKTLESYCADYLKFVSEAKTERVFYQMAIEILKRRKAKDLTKVKSVKSGDLVFLGNRGRTLMVAKVGKSPVSEGLRIVGGHIDSPRLDAKPVPLYEDGEIALLDTHYYGGIRKYQWVAMPLALHGVVVKANGDVVAINVGEKPDDPVFTVTDLLPHLAKDQNDKKLGEAITGEGLNVLLGSIPAKKADKDEKKKVKANILSILNKAHGVTEEDLVSAELQLVPAGPARELGLDRSMMLAYGHDDRVCSYAALRGLLDMTTTPDHTAVVLLCDKEEIGSIGATGMDSMFFENAIAELIDRQEKKPSNLTLRRCLEKSKMLSADVDALHDPNYPEVSSPNNNMAVMNGGVVLTKYTGSRGKSGASDASPEFVAELRTIFNKNDVVWQPGELGKVDQGGGGTIAMLLARYCMEVIDCGTGLFSMHAPWEVASKFDAYMTYKAYKSFMADRG